MQVQLHSRGGITKEELRMMQGALELQRLRVKDVMTPLDQVVRGVAKYWEINMSSPGFHERLLRAVSLLCATSKGSLACLFHAKACLQMAMATCIFHFEIDLQWGTVSEN